MTDKQIIIDEQMENLNNLATQQLKRIEEEKRQIEHIAKTHLVETFDMQREIDKLKKELQAKEQECEELKKIIDEAKNSKLDLKSFLVGEAVQNEYEQQLDQLKKENEELKEQLTILDDEDVVVEITVKQFEEYKKLKQTFTEIKEIAEKFYYRELGNRDCMDCDDYCFDKIRQKISEVENEN